MKSVIDYLKGSSEKLPHKVAFKDENDEMTYGELNHAVNAIGSALASLLKSRNLPIVVMVGRNVKSVASMLGVAASGNFYVPIDSDQPASRLELMFEQIRPAAVVVTMSETANRIACITDAPICEYGDLVSQEPEADVLRRVRETVLDSDPLFAICTSGSTGVPKVVLKSHRSVLEFVPSFARLFSFDEAEVFGNQAPFDFDVSTKDIYTTLYCGATTYIIPRTCFTMPKKLAAALEENSVSTLVWAVSALCVVSGLKAFKHTKPAGIKKILFSGEVMPIKHLNTWREYYPDGLFVNLYGPTESTGNCMYYIVDRDFELEDTLPLGKPFPNSRILVLDEEGKPVGSGQTGEVYIRGTSVAIGYYRDRERTSESFVQNPLNRNYPEIVYRTGDLARLDDNGELRFAARKDFQIKHMGHRIELEELEMHVNAVEGVARSCCAFDKAANKIVCYYEGSSSAGEILGKLKATLPKYMTPNRFERLDALPVTSNGKIDRQRLVRMTNRQS